MISNRRGLTRAQGVLACAVLLVLFMAGQWGWETWKEPRFKGRGVRYWIKQLPERFLPGDFAVLPPGGSEPDRAMQYFRESAVPYLIEATERPKRWQSGFLVKVPRRVLNRIVDLQRMDRVAVGAFQRLSELVQAEVHRNELVADRSYPVADQLIAVWKPQLEKNSSRELLGWVGYLGPKITNLAPELKAIWYQMNPSDDYWRSLTDLLSRTRDPSLTPALVQWSKSEKWVNVRPTPMTWVEVKSAAITALGWNGQVADEVVAALRSGLRSSNETVIFVTLEACYQLGVCLEEALAKIQEKRTESPWKIGEWAVRSSEWLEQMLSWRAKTNQLTAERWIRANLSEGTVNRGVPALRYFWEVGPAAKEFVPEIEAIAKGSDATARTLAIRVLWRVDPAAAERVVRGGP